MSKFPKIVNLERHYFEDACYSAHNFTSALSKRYQDAGLKMPVDVKCLVWIADCAFALLQPYVKTLRSLQNDNVHQSENY